MNSFPFKKQTNKKYCSQIRIALKVRFEKFVFDIFFP